MTDLSPSQVLEAFQVPCHPNWFTIGFGESRVTVYTQQIRALNLAWALSELGRANNAKVIVVGGGAAGLSIAAGLANRGANVTVLEKERQLMPLQRNCHKRHLHPHVFDWPEATANNTRADLPLLDWSAGSARHVALQIEDGFDELKRRYRGLLDCKCTATNLEIDTPAAGQISFRTTEPGRERFTLPYTILVFAIGFGVEDSFWGGRRGSYWADDSLEQFGVTVPGRYLVSGTGDGGLIDLFRLLLPDLRQEGFVALVRDGIPDQKRFLEWIREIDASATSFGATGRTATRSESEGSSLWQSYKAFPESFENETLDAKLRLRLQENVFVTLVSRSPSPFSLATRPLHRFIFSRLLFASAFVDRVELKARLHLTQEMLTSCRTKVALQGEEFEHAIVRHGPNRETVYAAFPMLAKAVEKWVPRSIGTERQFPQTYFGAPGSAYRGTGGITLEEYVDELWGRGYMTDGVADRILLSEFATIAVELRGVSADQRWPREPPPETDEDDQSSEPDRTSKTRTWSQEQAPGFEVQDREREKRAREEAAGLLRTRWATAVFGFAFTPALDAFDVTHPTLIEGQAGTGKSTLVRHLVHRQLERFANDESTPFPVFVAVQPDLDNWGADVPAALADAALRTLELPGFSRAEGALRRKLSGPPDTMASSTRCLVLLDSVENWRPEVLRTVLHALMRRGHQVICCARQFPDSITTIGGTPIRLRLLGVAPASRIEYLRKVWGSLRGLPPELPQRRLVREIPFLLLEFARVHYETSRIPSSLREQYQARFRQLLPDSTLREKAGQFARRMLCSNPPRFHFSADAVPDDLRRRGREVGLFTGSRALEFAHLTYGEFLAAETMSDQDLSNARADIDKAENRWEHQLEVVAMASGSTLERLLDCLDFPKIGVTPRRLALLLRALAYGGEAVERFIATHSALLLEALAALLEHPSGRFGEREREVVRMALAVLPELELQGPHIWRRPHLSGDPEAAAWALQRMLGGSSESPAPASYWWDTIFAEAKALKASGATISQVVELAEGAADTSEQSDALAALNSPIRAVALLTSPDELDRHCSFRLIRELPHQLALLTAPEAWLRRRGLQQIPAPVASQRAFAHVLRALALRDPSRDARAGALSLLNPTDFAALVPSLTTDIMNLLRHHKTISSDDMAFFKALLPHFVDLPEFQAALNEFVREGWHWFCQKDEVLLLLRSPERLELQRERLRKPEVSGHDVEAAAGLPVLHDTVREILRRHVLDRTEPGLVATCLSSLTSDAEVREECLACLDWPIPSSEGNERAHWAEKRVRAAAALLLARAPDAEAVLKAQLDANRNPIATYAVLGVKEFQTTELAATIAKGLVMSSWDLGLRNPWHNETNDAVKVLVQHPSERELLLNLLRRGESDPNHRASHYRRETILKAFQDSMTVDEMLKYVDDSSAPVRDVCVGWLLARKDQLGPEQKTKLRTRALVEKSSSARRLLWRTFMDDEAVRKHVEVKSREDLFALRRAFFLEMSDQESALNRLRAFAELELEQHEHGPILHERGPILFDLIEPLARDPSARPLILKILERGGRLAERVMHVLKHDDEVRKKARLLLSEPNWVQKFAMSNALERYFGDDPEAKRKLFDEGLAKTLPLREADLVALLGRYEPAREWIIGLARSSSDRDVRREAMTIYRDDEEVKAQLLLNLQLDWSDSKNRPAIEDAVRCASGEPWALPHIAGLYAFPDKHTRREAFLAAVQMGHLPGVLSDRGQTDLQARESEASLRMEFVEQLARTILSKEERLGVALRSAIHDFDPDVRRAAARHLHSAEEHDPSSGAESPFLRDVLKAVTFAPPPLTPLHHAQELESFDRFCQWILLRLCSTLPDIATWDTASDYVDEVTGLFGERVSGTPEGVTLVRFAKDAFELPRDRRIYPAANVVFAWLRASNLVASSRRAFFVACADLHSKHLLAVLPELDPGEVCLGPVFFGFRLREATQGSAPNPATE